MQAIELLPIVGDHLVVLEGRRLLVTGAALDSEPAAVVPEEAIRRTAGHGILAAQSVHGPHGAQVLGRDGLARGARLMDHFFSRIYVTFSKLFFRVFKQEPR